MSLEKEIERHNKKSGKIDQIRKEMIEMEDKFIKQMIEMEKDEIVAVYEKLEDSPLKFKLYERLHKLGKM